jgi:flavin reductase (DIM6/NTAB) family NADH-FMN oxidoreductase RutF
MTRPLRPPSPDETAVLAAPAHDPKAADPARSQAYRDGMARIASAVNIIATDGPAGRTGFTATAVASISDSPPTLLVCLNRASASAARLVANGVFCVNTLSAAQAGLAEDFAGRSGLHGEARFGNGIWSVLATGAPLLEGALASFDCRLVEVRDIATHHVLVGEVEAIRIGTAGESLVYLDRAYRSVTGG